MKLISGLVLTAMIASFVVVPTTPVSAATIYKYEWVAQSGTISPDGYAHQYTNLVPGQTLDLWLTLTNRSGQPIVGKSNLPPIEPGKQVPVGAWGIGTQNPQDGTPYFLDSSSFVLNNNRFVYYDNENLGDWPNGSSRTMGWTIKLANNLADGVYDLYYRPVCEYLAWTQQVKNGYTLPGTDSDIFTRLIVGTGVSTSRVIYFGKGRDGNYAKIDTLTEQSKELILAGYSLLGQHGFLQKGSYLYSYNLDNKLLNSVFAFDGLKLQSDEKASVDPSITEKDKFIIRIDKFDYSQSPSEFLGTYPIISTRTYTFNASINQLIKISNFNLASSNSTCSKYDSKNQRYFKWLCGEGIGSSVPLSTVNLNGLSEQVIVSDENSSVEVQNSLFIVPQSKYTGNSFTFTQFTVVDPQFSTPTKSVYAVDDFVQSNIAETHGISAYSIAIDQSSNKIIIGGNSFILLLHHNSNNLVTGYAYIPDAAIYANFIFVDNGKLYYQAPNYIRVINLSTERLEKSISSVKTEEMTLFR